MMSKQTKGLEAYSVDNLPVLHPYSYLRSAYVEVIPEGLEPSTYCLEGSCSIQLS